jgi:hypothetical protein
VCCFPCLNAVIPSVRPASTQTGIIPPNHPQPTVRASLRNLTPLIVVSRAFRSLVLFHLVLSPSLTLFLLSQPAPAAPAASPEPAQSRRRINGRIGQEAGRSSQVSTASLDSLSSVPALFHAGPIIPRVASLALHGFHSDCPHKSILPTNAVWSSSKTGWLVTDATV